MLDGRLAKATMQALSSIIDIIMSVSQGAYGLSCPVCCQARDLSPWGCPYDSVSSSLAPAIRPPPKPVGGRNRGVPECIQCIASCSLRSFSPPSPLPPWRAMLA
ncbi:hypothetical protein M433DRAFT_434590 [Acidomyces richmondensis BFW]|nr:MAG: hypothetical protein FE78DRAFT_238630 [Acidomyces sp. 'richmondensis']KYG48230.1 hypothetical protein M433DRAFT_434590 [Acidomyces richmondensis BFW]